MIWGWRFPKKDETIVIGAHYDHLGIRHGRIYFGADDNASGCAAVLEIARNFVRSGIQPMRNVLFAFFDGEEPGKYGSKVYMSAVDTPPWIATIDPPVFMLNFDMVGRSTDGYLEVSGTGTSPVLSGWVEQAHRQVPELNLDLLEMPNLHSDHVAFMAYGVPVIRFYTGGHRDYHRPSDVWQKINFPGLEKITALGFHIAGAAALDTRDLSSFVRPHSSVAEFMKVRADIIERDSLK